MKSAIYKWFWSWKNKMEGNRLQKYTENELNNNLKLNIKEKHYERAYDLSYCAISIGGNRFFF